MEGVPVNTRCQCFEYISLILADHNSNRVVSLFSFSTIIVSLLSILPPSQSSWLQKGRLLEYALKGSCTVRWYPFCVLWLVPMLEKPNYWLFPGLGLYSGVFAMYLHWTSENSTGRTPTIFYALCVLYILSTVTVVGDLLQNIFLNVSTNNSIILPVRISFFNQLFRHLTHWQRDQGLSLRMFKP